MQPIKQKLDRYKYIEKIGEGTYGKVYKAINKENGEYFALKKIILEQDEKGIPSTAIREIALQKKLDHINIVKQIDVVHFSNKLVLIFEYAQQDLKDYLANRETPPTIPEVKKLVYQLLKGLDFCHKHNIIHRDLKPQNLLLTSEGVQKIADFGLARPTTIPMKGYTNEVVTLWYRPPDVLQGSRNYDDRIDVWSVGCIMVELLNKKPQFMGKNEEDQCNVIFEKMGSPTPDEWPEVESLPELHKFNIQLTPGIPQEDCCKVQDDEGLHLQDMMLQMNPKNRATAEICLKHYWFDSVRGELESLYN